MDVIDRYLRTLRVLLPKDQRDDIVRELSEEMHSQIADQEMALARPLTAVEKAAVVGQFGHPLVTAARYRPQRYLIGPIVFPHYWMVLKVVLGLMVAGNLVGALMLVAGGTTVTDLGPHLSAAFANALKVIGWLTVLAAWLDLWLSRSNVLKSWRPSLTSTPSHVAEGAIASALGSLPRARRTGSPGLPASANASEPSIAGLMVTVIVSVWWLAGLRMPTLFFGSGATALDWGPAMDQLYPVLVAAQLTMVVDQLLRWRARESAVMLGLIRVSWIVAGWALVYVVATSDHQWMISRDGGPVPIGIVHIGGRDLPVLEFVNYIWSTIFVFVAAMCAWSSLKGITRRLRRTPRPAHA
jgi:hypothetical protein